MRQWEYTKTIKEILIVSFSHLDSPLENQPLFQNISAPGIDEMLDVSVTQQKYFSASKREQELNAELVY